MTAPLIFLDCETTGLEPDDDIWELAAIRREPSGDTGTWVYRVEHDLAKAARLPEPFRGDHERRYNADHAITREELADLIGHVFTVPDGTPYDQRPHVIGAVPSFDTRHLERVLRGHGRPIPWHHHIQDAETLALGYVAAMAKEYPDSRYANYLAEGVPPIHSDDLSSLIGVDPERFARHTALGDAQWAMAIWDHVMSGGD